MKFILLFSLLCVRVAFGQNDTISFELEDTDTYEYFTIEDSVRPQYFLPDSFELTPKWKKKQQGMDWYGGPLDDSLDLKTILSWLDTSSFFFHVRVAKSWSRENYREIFPHLIARLGVKQKIGLKYTADLIIPGRMHTGDLQHYGHGGVIPEDLFTVAGRVSWILNEITGEDFASVKGTLTKEEVQDYKKQWVEYIQQLN